MDDLVPKGLKTFDAFPKVSSSYSIRSSRGGAVTVILAVGCLFLIWVQLADYLGGIEEQTFFVDNHVAKDLQINLDLTLNMPCEGVTIHVVDQSGDRLLAHELLTFEPAEFDSSAAHLLTESEGYDDMRGVMKKARKSKMKAHKQPADGSACRIYGSIPVTRVRGDLHITAKGYGYRDRRVLRPDQLNFTHIIDEFSFGTYYPKLINPLDGTVVVAENSMEHIKYFLSVVRTKYRSYSTGYTVDTNQYAVTEMKGATNEGRLSHPPGLFFKYDLEPIALNITDRRLPFSQWLVRSVNIIGGVIVCTGSLYRLFEAACGKALRQSRVKSGMLDKLEE